jgi:hypothetical protein
MWKTLNIYPVNDTIEQYRNNWLQHINRMQGTRLSKTALQYRPSGEILEDQRKDGEMQCEDRRPWTYLQVLFYSLFCLNKLLNMAIVPCWDER